MAWLAVRWPRRRRGDSTLPFGLLFWLSLAASGAGVALFVVSHFVIGSVCLLCGATYFVNFGLVVAAWLELRAAPRGPVAAVREETTELRVRPRPLVVLVVVLVAGLFVLSSAVPAYWRFEVSTGPGGLAVGMTGDGDRWIGARSPSVTVLEYSDYQCPHCQRGHEELRRQVEANPESLRLVHRHFPLDQKCNSAVRRPFHPYACDYAWLSFCAGEQGKFWDANDFLFANGRRREPVTSGELAAAIGVDRSALANCMDGASARAAIGHDLDSGRSRNVRGTPTFFMNGERFDGRIPAAELESALGRTPSGPSD